MSAKQQTSQILSTDTPTGNNNPQSVDPTSRFSDQEVSSERQKKDSLELMEHLSNPGNFPPSQQNSYANDSQDPTCKDFKQTLVSLDPKEEKDATMERP